MSDVKKSYFIKRFEDEIAAADHASTKEVRLVHLELALRYSMKVSRRRSKSPAIATIAAFTVISSRH